jgi:hypothetical protein
MDSSEPHGAVDALESHGVPSARADGQEGERAALLREKPRMRLGGHNMGPVPVLLGAAMNAIKETAEDYARNCETKPAWWTDEGGGTQHQAKRLRYFRRTQHPPACPRSVCITLSRFVEASPLEVCASLRLSPLGIALAPGICNITKHLSSCLHLAGVADHPAGSCAEAFGLSTAPFAHARPDGLKAMSDSYRAEMRRRLHIHTLLSRMGCFTEPHQDKLSTDSCIVLLALHAGSGGRGQWKIALLNPSYLGEKELTSTADGDRAGARVLELHLHAPQRRCLRHRHVHRPRELLLLARPRGCQDGGGPVRVADHGADWLPVLPGQPEAS